jgi:hypothetical protein
MAWGIPDYKTVHRVFRKREVALMHAIKNAHSREKLVKAAENLREAKLKIFKSKFAEHSVLPASAYKPGPEALEWERLSVDEILKTYNSNQVVQSTPLRVVTDDLRSTTT